jgi:hypothetical protein
MNIRPCVTSTSKKVKGFCLYLVLATSLLSWKSSSFANRLPSSRGQRRFRSWCVPTSVYLCLTQDLPPEQIEVDIQACIEYFAKFKIPVLTTSAKDMVNVNESFEQLIRECRLLSNEKETPKKAKKKNACVLM